ncbi:T9SS type A sorting domain-containing protein [Salinivirga cyanobacteriivorans]
MLLRKFTLLIAIFAIQSNVMSQELNEIKKIENEIIQNQGAKDRMVNKAISSTGMRLDSVIEQSYYDVTGQFVNNEKHVLSFDDDNKLTLWLQYAVDEVTGNWVNDAKEEFNYDEQGNEILNIEYEWDSEASAWEPIEKIENVYNVYGNLTQFVRFNWDTINNAWLPDLKSNTTYDSAQNATEHVYKLWNASTDSWDNYFIRYYGYDSDNNTTFSYVMYWSDYSSTYKKQYRYELSYDDSLVLQSIRYDGDTINDVWIEDSKTEYSYNSFGNQTQYIYYQMESSWQPQSKTAFAYDNSQNETSETVFAWDENNSEWYPNYRYERDFDASNNMIEMIYSSWDPNTDSWDNSQKWTREYENNLVYNDLIIPLSFHYSGINAFGAPEEVFRHQLVSRSEYDWNSTDDVWDGTVLEHFYYSEQPLNIANTANKAFSVYPNPVSGNLYIESDTDISEIRVIDVTGRYVRSESAPGNKEMINLSDLEEGMYFVRLLLSNGEYETKRIIKE